MPSTDDGLGGHNDEIEIELSVHTVFRTADSVAYESVDLWPVVCGLWPEGAHKGTKGSRLIAVEHSREEI